MSYKFNSSENINLIHGAKQYLIKIGRKKKKKQLKFKPVEKILRRGRRPTLLSLAISLKPLELLINGSRKQVRMSYHYLRKKLPSWRLKLKWSNGCLALPRALHCLNPHTPRLETLESNSRPCESKHRATLQPNCKPNPHQQQEEQTKKSIKQANDR